MLMRFSVIAFLVMSTWAAASELSAKDDCAATLETIVLKLDVIIGRIEQLEQRVSQLETRFASRPQSEIFGTLGPYRIGKFGYLYDENDREVGILGVNGGDSVR